MVILRVRLFDGPAVERAGEETARFRSLKVQGLLAFLALRLGRRCPREEIAEALWPNGSDPGVKANRLRVTLASLRRQIEPPGVAFGSVLDVSVPGCVVLRETTVACDVAEFERAYAAGRLDEAGALLRGPLAPGLYDEWIRDHQLRYEMLREDLGEDDPTRSVIPVPPTTLGFRGEEVPFCPPLRLPLYLTRFVARDEERTRLLAALEAGTLVTLTGPGGIGKTRLAVETAPSLGIAVAFASLASAEGGSGVAEAVLRVLGVQSRSADAPTDALLAPSARAPTDASRA